MTIFNCKREGDPVRDAVKPVLEEMLKEGAKQEDVAAALQKAQKGLVLGCEGCWTSIKNDVLWVHAYVEAEKKLLEEIERHVAPEISALCFLHKAAAIADDISDDEAVGFYGGTTRKEDGSEEHWGILVPKLMEIPEADRDIKWLTYILARQEPPIFKLWYDGSKGKLMSDPELDVDQLYECIFQDGRAECAYIHIGYPGRNTELAKHVGPAGCYLLLRNRRALDTVPACLVLHLRAFVQTLVTAQLAVLARHLHQRERSKVEELRKYHSMYNQLLSPLRSLTEAVRRTQEDAHEIAAIIHDPLDVLLGRQSAIAELFIQDTLVSVPLQEASVRVKHNPNEYSLNDAASLAAELLHRLIPGVARDLRAQCATNTFKGMVARLADWEVDRTSGYSWFCAAFRQFLNSSSWNISCKSGHTNSWNGINTCLTSGCSETARITAIKFLESAKDRFFTLYKPDRAAEEALSWEVLRAYLSTIQVDDQDLLVPPEKLENEVVLPKGSNPLDTHGHVVAFVGRVVAQHLSYHRQKGNSVQLAFSNIQPSGHPCTTVFVVQSNKAWLPEHDKFSQFLTEQIGYRDRGVRAAREFGDLKRPFVDLIERVPLGVKATASSQDSLQLCIGKLMFQFSGAAFKMISKCEVAS